MKRLSYLVIFLTFVSFANSQAVLISAKNGIEYDDFNWWHWNKRNKTPMGTIYLGTLGLNGVSLGAGYGMGFRKYGISATLKGHYYWNESKVTPQKMMYGPEVRASIHGLLFKAGLLLNESEYKKSYIGVGYTFHY